MPLFNSAHFSDLEIKTRDLLATAPDETSMDVVIKGVFRAMWSSALPVDRIAKVGAALYGYESINEELLKARLTKFVRAKVLRSRVSEGKRLYEVAF